ncbi:MAG: acetylglutamate kinase [Planctomycetota bacterium]|nr:acetylglutamate kinase [Planctomycetota bacterium]
MEQAIQKAAVLIEALPYIQSFQSKPVVIKLGGAGMDDNDLLHSVLRDIVFMRVVGMHPIIVHGGGPFITRAMSESGLEPAFVHGHRTTDAATLEIVERVLLGDVNWMLVRMLQELEGKAAPLHVRLVPFIRAVQRQFESEDGETYNLEFVGEITDVETEFIEELCQVGRIPVIAPMGVDGNGQLYNINADDGASKIAQALNAEKIVFFTNVPGVMRDPEDSSTLYSSLREDEVNSLIEEGVIAGGMLPKIESCLEAVNGGVHKAHIVDTGIDHSLLLEIFTDQGVGTQIEK